MTRRKRYEQCLFWRGFISQVNRIKDFDQLRSFVIRVTEIDRIQVEYGWTTWVTVSLKEGKEFVDYNSTPILALKSVCNEIYRHVTGKYIDYIKTN
jgi:hypothetical protein